ncbi:MAG: cytochrome b N-terminal domain-containing protein [Cyanobacteria bacterium P01_F01_bin.86]
MSNKDRELATKAGELLRRFPEAWQMHQDWLHDVVSSRSVLLARHPAWQASLIFRWRLLYFGFYVATVIFLNRFLRHDRGTRVTSQVLNTEASSDAAISTPFMPSLDRYRYSLQRIATLLAVAELTLCGLAAFTGILLAFYYQPAAREAHASLVAIAQNISSGALILSLHNIAGNGLIILGLVQIVVMFLGRQFLPSWLTGWISGVLLTLTAIGLSWTAIVLTWEQTSFWRFKLELNIVGSIPLIGSPLRAILSGGSSINSITLQHMYALHSYVLAIAAILLSILHLTALILQERTWKSTAYQPSFATLGRKSDNDTDTPAISE